MAEGLENLATRRSRRSTAGNRMEAALAEIALEDTSKDLDDDREFVNDKDEEDVFESDFTSTDDEANQGDLDTGEKAIEDEEKSARKVARARLEKRTAAAHTKHAAAFNPQAVAPSVVKPKLKPKQTSALFTVGTSDGAVIGVEMPRRTGQKRKSQRRHTVLNTSATVTRLKETEEKRASAPKKFKPTVRSFSQSELIARALDNEEGNIKEHRNYLQVEEEKRRKARVIKMPVVEGPRLRWTSKIEEEKFKVSVEVPQPQQPAAPPPAPSYASYYEAYSLYANYLSRLIASSASTTSSPTTPAPQTTPVPSSSGPQQGTELTSEKTVAGQAPSQPTQVTTSSITSVTTSPTPASTTSQIPNQPFSTFRLSTTPSTMYPAFAYYTPTATNNAATSSTFQPSLFGPISTAVAPSQPPPRQFVEEERTEKVTKNYVIHELDQRDGTAKPSWKDMMKALFGDHVKWEELKMLSGKGRPMSRVKQRCPITGKIAPYLDPRTGVPFADVEAYRILSDVLDHTYTWSPELGCYVDK